MQNNVGLTFPVLVAVALLKLGLVIFGECDLFEILFNCM